MLQRKTATEKMFQKDAKLKYKFYQKVATAQTLPKKLSQKHCYRKDVMEIMLGKNIDFAKIYF